MRRAAEQLAAQFNADRIALAIASTVRSSELAMLEAQHRTADRLAAMQLPHLPTRDELVARARVLFAKTPSLDEIIDKAHELLLASVSARLSSVLGVQGSALLGEAADPCRDGAR